MTFQNVFFTSGLELGEPVWNEKILTICNNTLTKTTDILYVIGNLVDRHANVPGTNKSYYSKIVSNFINNLNGSIIIIPGVNDEGFFNCSYISPDIKSKIVSKIETVRFDGSTFVLSYWPLSLWPKRDRGSKLLHGMYDFKKENTLSVNFRKHDYKLLHCNKVSVLIEAKNIPF